MSETLSEMMERLGLLGPPIAFEIRGRYNDMRDLPPASSDGRYRLAWCPYCAAPACRIDQEDGLATYTCDQGHDYLGPFVYLRLPVDWDAPPPGYRPQHIHVTSAEP